MPELIRPLIITHPLTLQVTGDTTLTKHFDRIEIDGSAGDVTITLPDNANPFKGRNAMEFIRVDDFANINFIVKIVAETPSNLAETDNEIILDIELSVQVYFSSVDNKYRSVNGFSEKRIQELLTRSTSSYVAGYATQANYLEINTTAQAHETLDINQSGTGWIYDRTTEKFKSRPFKIKWDSADTQALDSTPPNTDGQFLVMLDKDGTIIIESVNELPILPSFNDGGRNSNTELQIGLFFRDSGVISATNAGGGEKVNTAIRVDDTLDTLGVVNSATNPYLISFNGANLNLDLSAGQALVRATGFLTDIGGLAPDIENLDAPITQITIIFATRDGTIQGITSPGTMNVTQFEDPNNPGTLITIINDTKAKVNFYKAFPSDSFLGEIPGQAEYISVAAAVAADEDPEFPSLVAFGVPIQKICILKNETDPPTNAVIKSFPRIDLLI